MSSNFLCALLILAFLESGKSNSDVSISHSRDGDGQNITCVLSGDENMTQINWEMLRGPNRTKLGTYHPYFGTYINGDYKTTVKIQKKTSPRQSSSLIIKVASNESVVHICCAFITFPSGKLEQCTDISKKDVSINASTIKDFTYMEQKPKLGIFGRLGAIIIGTILSLLILTILFYLCRNNNCRRMKSFEIRTNRTDSPSETHAEESDDAPTSQSSPNGFDPSKLYAKIKKDLFYGRLWKSYQGQPKAWTQGTMTDQGHVYHLLGQSPLPKRNVEGSPLRPDTTE
ncbi:immunoglobulin domain-containing protein [Rhinichthys klamathensis goyatoka]|uniref:immunoglobulin domain-containing protein n=1 Tax=Rhinichthys klamathensis goyatoka TaxID=3034132 RepID=UPI0024B57C9C|nr:immunoglobulin domain-containing protein [Rhinichthys klamathensis goyatoka]